MADYRNGEVPASLLRPVSNFHPLIANVNAAAGSNLLREDAWAALNMLQVAFVARFGRSLNISEAYRKRALQDYYWDLYIRGIGNLAAKPGTSNHGWAISCDFGSGASVYGSATKIWLDANAPRFGWWPTGNDFSRREGWHFDFIPNTATETIPASGDITPIEEEFLSEAQYQDIVRRLADLQTGLNAVGNTTRADLDNTNRLGEYARGAEKSLNSLGDDLRATTKKVEDVQANVNTVGDQNRDTHDRIAGVLTYVTETRRLLSAGLDNVASLGTKVWGVANNIARKVGAQTIEK